MPIPSWSTFTFDAANASLGTNDVHLWRIHLASSHSSLEGKRDSPESWLSSHEKERANRLVHKSHAHRFRRTHSELRAILSQYLNVSPSKIEFCITEQGKPSISSPNASIQFNLSHSGDYSLVAITQQVSVGIDIERKRNVRNLTAIAEKFFMPQEYKSLLQLDEESQKNHFFRLWTLKESFLKALGATLKRPLDHIEIDFNTNEEPSIRKTRCETIPMEQWSIHSIVLPDGYYAALSIALPKPHIHYYHWDSSKQI